MESMIELLFSAYLSNGFDKVVPKYQYGEAEKKFDTLWDKLNSELTNDEKRENGEVLCDATYENDKRTFRDAFRLGFLLCAEVFMHE